MTTSSGGEGAPQFEPPKVEQFGVRAQLEQLRGCGCGCGCGGEGGAGGGAGLTAEQPTELKR